MTAKPTPATVAILTFPETTASVVYGMYDLFMSAGRDWEMIVEGKPGPSLVRPVIVAAKAESFEATNGVLIAPQVAITEIPTPDIVCVPELTIPPGEPRDASRKRSPGCNAATRPERHSPPPAPARCFLPKPDY